MKKVIAALTLAAAGAASAGTASLSVINDTEVDRVGTRVTLAGDKPVFWGIVPFVSGSFTNQYARFAAGGEVGLFSVGPVKVSGNVAFVRQQSSNSSNGNGGAFGLRATYALTKNVNLVAGVESFDGNSRIEKFDGTVTSVGISTKF